MNSIGPFVPAQAGTQSEGESLTVILGSRLRGNDGESQYLYGSISSRGKALKTCGMVTGCAG
jgi:hypothetical protein